MDAEFIHGLNGYHLHRCRCDVCRTARRLQGRKDRLKAGIVPRSDIPKRHSYGSYAHGCPCEICCEAARIHGREYYKRTAEARRKYLREQYARDRRRILARGKAWRDKHPERVLEVAKRRRENHPEDIKAAARRFRQTERGKLSGRCFSAAYKARKRNAAGRCTRVQLKARIEYYGGRCWMCGAVADTLDHVIPLARGGSNWPANIRPACKRCNFSKQDRRIA